MLANKQREAQVIEQRLVVEIDEAAELAALVNGEPVVAAVAVEPDRHVIDHLREGERNHDEINAAGAQAESADHQREQCRDYDRRRPLDEARANTFLRQNADGIAAETEIGGMAEAHHAAIAHDQIEAHGCHSQDQHAGEQRHDEGVAGQRRVERDQRQDNQEADGYRIARIELERRAHLLAAGNSPSGRNTRMPAISI